MDKIDLINVIDTLLPQTQCTKCGYQGCRPYAEAIATGEAINKCPPGGEETLRALAALVDKPVVALEAENPAPALVAFIREAECIGCTKCIQACPVDAIVGAAKLMHTVLASECTGCDLCVVPCPVDCIELQPLPITFVPLTGDSVVGKPQGVARQLRRDHARKRFELRNNRLKHEEALRLAQRRNRLVTEVRVAPVKSVVEKANIATSGAVSLTDEQKRLKIEAAMAQVALKKLEKQLQQYNTPELQQQTKLLKAKVEESQQALQQAMLRSTS